MTESERIGFKTEITEIRNKLRLAKDTMTNSALKTALADVRLHPTKIVHNTLHDKIKRSGFLQEFERHEIKMALLAIYNHIKI